MSRNAIGSAAIAGAIAGIVAALSKIESRILRIISLPDFVVPHSVTHPEELGDNEPANERSGTGETWAAARFNVRAPDRRVV
jgi:hypothetical protein